MKEPAISGYNAWVMHFHVGWAKAPFTVDRMAQDEYEVWWANEKFTNLNAHQTMAMVSKIMSIAIGHNEPISM